MRQFIRLAFIGMKGCEFLKDLILTHDHVLVKCCPHPKGPGKRGHIVADTLLPMVFLGMRRLGNICGGHKMFLNKIRNIFSRRQNLCSQQMLCRQQCVSSNVSLFARALTRACSSQND